MGMQLSRKWCKQPALDILGISVECVRAERGEGERIRYIYMI